MRFVLFYISPFTIFSFGSFLLLTTSNRVSFYPRVEIPQPMLRPNLVEIMLGPKCEAGARGRVRKFLDDL
jgi:hypothetical protein